MNISTNVTDKILRFPVVTTALLIMLCILCIVYVVASEKQKEKAKTKKKVNSKIPGMPKIPPTLVKNPEKREGGLRKNDSASLTPESELQKLKAVELAKMGDYLGAARVLEDIQLHREAVELLETNNLLDEAATLLMRLNKPNRAGALYERNKIFEKAAIYYLRAKLIEEAKRCCKQIPKLTHPLSIELAVLFAEAGDRATAIRLLAIINEKSRIIKIVHDTFAFTELALFLDQPAARKLLLDILSATDITHMLEKMPSDLIAPLDRARQWLNEGRKSEWIIPIFHYIADKRDVAHNFTKKIDKPIIDAFSSHVATSNSDYLSKNSENLILIARAFHDAEHWEAAAVIYEKIDFMTLAGKCWALSGKEHNAIKALKSTNGDSALVEKYLAELVKIGRVNSEEKPLEAREIYSLTQCFFNVDPDVEKRRLESPFSIAS